MNCPIRRTAASRCFRFLSLLLVGIAATWFVAQPTPAAAQDTFPRVALPAELPDHPRLFWNNEEIREFKAWMAREPWLAEYIAEMKADLLKTVDNPELPGKNQSRNVKIGQQAHSYAIAYVLSDDRRFAEAAAKILRAYVQAFPNYKIAHFKGLATESTLGECDWAINVTSAYDLIYNSGVLSDEDKQNIEQKVFKPSGEVMRICNHRFRSNWRGRAIAGAAVIGFCINDQSLMDEAVNGYYTEDGKLARDGFVQHVAWSILADGVFYERSMHYHMYTAEAYTIIAEAARHSGIDLWNLEIPGHSLDAGADMQRKFGETGPKTMRYIFDSPFYQAFSDGTLVRLGNSYTDRLERTRCLERVWAAYKDPKYAWIANRKVRFYRPIAGGGYIEPEDRTEAHKSKGPIDDADKSRRPLNPVELVWLAPDMPAGHFSHEADTQVGVTGRHENYCSHLPNGGITVLRQSFKPKTVGVQMTYGDWGSAHTHAELLAIAINAGGSQIVPEVRYHHYGHGDFLSWDRQTIAHNTVTVDEVSQYPQDGIDDPWVVERNRKQAHGYSVLFHAGEKLKATRAKCEAAHDGVLLDRTTALVGDVVVDFYRCRSESEHKYDFALHVDGKLSDSSVEFNAAKSGPYMDKFGYMHLLDSRTAQAATPKTELTYDGYFDGPRMRLQLLSQGTTELVSAQGHVDLDNNPKDALLLRKQGKNVDFVNVLTFGQNDKVQARRLTDTPEGVQGVALTLPGGDVQIVLSAEESGTYEYAGQTFTGQLALLHKARTGGVILVDVAK